MNSSGLQEGTTTVRQCRSLLESEVHYLHYLLFRRNPASALIDAYVNAHEEIQELRSTNEQHVTVRRIVEGRLDAIGIEPWLRHTHSDRRHLLSSKMMLIAYLAECDGTSPEFSRLAVGRLRGYVGLASAGLHAIIRLMRGRIQKTVHGLI